MNAAARTSRVFGEEIRSHHAAAPRTTLAKGSGEDPVSARRVDLPAPAQHCTVILAESLQLAAGVDARRRLRSGDSTTLVVPATRC